MVGPYPAGRVGQFQDVMVDMAGVIAVLLLVYLSAVLRKENS